MFLSIQKYLKTRKKMHSTIAPSTGLPPQPADAHGIDATRPAPDRRVILVCGANGFIGAALCRALAGRTGHCVIKGVRRPRAKDEIAIDYTTDIDPALWLPRLQGIDVVINAVGIMGEHGEQTYERIHRDAPIALFEACRRAHVPRVIQISALGAQTGDARFLRTKLAADAHLQSLSLAHHILRPSLVYGTNGTSARNFRALASMPWHLLPAGGHQKLRPVHIDDLAETVVRLLQREGTDTHASAGEHTAAPTSGKTAAALDEPFLSPRPLDVVGGTEVDYRRMLAAYRASMGFAAAPRLTIPAWIMAAGAALLQRVPGSLFTRETWRMLQAGSTADAGPMASVLGRMPAGIDTFIPLEEAPALRQQALAAWRAILLRGALALTWLWTALCSAFIYPRTDSLALLAGVHLHGIPALAALYLATTMDTAFGIATVLRPGRRLWAMQMGLILGYSAIIAIALPEFLWHPFGPILKNVPILALLCLLFSEETRP